MFDSVSPFRRAPNVEQTSTPNKSEDSLKSKKVKEVAADHLEEKAGTHLENSSILAKHKIGPVHKKKESMENKAALLNKALINLHKDWQTVTYHQYPTLKDAKKAIDFLQMYAATFSKASPDHATQAISSLERIKGELPRNTLSRDKKELIFDDIARSFQVFNSLLDQSTQQQREEFKEDILKANKALNEFFNSLPNRDD